MKDKRDNRLKITPIGRNLWELVDNFYQRTALGFIIVDKGFKTDLASTPKILWPILPPHGRYTNAAVVHDFMLSHPKYTKFEADLAFYELLRRYDVGRFKAWIMFKAVRIFGGRKTKPKSI